MGDDYESYLKILWLPFSANHRMYLIYSESVLFLWFSFQKDLTELKMNYPQRPLVKMLEQLTRIALVFWPLGPLLLKFGSL